MLTRRSFHGGVAAVLLSTPVTASFAQENEEIILESQLPPLPDDLAALEGLPPVTSYDDTQMVGVQRPNPEEIDTGTQVLLGAPYDTTPLTVAEYFHDIGQGGKYPEALRKYAREWPVRANPVIHQFFTATQTFPEGDVTPWCAAFINWCIARALVKDSDAIGRSPAYYVNQGKPFSKNVLDMTSKSAASGSFRV